MLEFKSCLHSEGWGKNPPSLCLGAVWGFSVGHNGGEGRSEKSLAHPGSLLTSRSQCNVH